MLKSLDNINLITLNIFHLFKLIFIYVIAFFTKAPSHSKCYPYQLLQENEKHCYEIKQIASHISYYRKTVLGVLAGVPWILKYILSFFSSKMGSV